jgi:hypothetical protein
MIAGWEIVMDSIRQDLLVDFALSEIDQLLNKFDHCEQIEAALPLLHQHRRTLTRLRDALHPGDSNLETDHERWLDDLLTTYRQFGGQVPHTTVYRKMKELRTEGGCHGRSTRRKSSGKRFRRTMPNRLSIGMD